MTNMGISASLIQIDLLKARRALEKANVKQPYFAVVDPKYSEEDVIKILGNILY